MSSTRAASFFKPLLFLAILALTLNEVVNAEGEGQSILGLGPFVKRHQRERIIWTENGEVSEAKVTDGNQSFQLHFITLDPNSLFLPVILHADMVFYVQTGSGRLTYQDEDEKEQRTLRRGDIHRLRSGSVFFIQSDLETERQKLRIIAVFHDSENAFNGPAIGPYSSIRDVVLGFDKRVLQAIFRVPEHVIEEITNGTTPPAIVHGLERKRSTMQELEYEIMEKVYNTFAPRNKQKKSKLFNIFSEDPDFKNCNGWSTTVNKKKYRPLKGSKFGLFMVNLNTGSMMGPHWNGEEIEIAVVLQGKGMIRVVCSSMVSVSGCTNSRYEVEEGDVFLVPRFHPMAQMAFNNETFVFVGFSTSEKKSHPQYVAGKASVLRTLDKHVLATAFGVDDATFGKILDQQDDAVILACTSCAEEEWMRMQEEEARRKEEERRREEEEARRKAEEKRREEEEARKKEEEEAKRREEEAASKRREEEEARRREQEERERREQQQREQEERAAQEKAQEEAEKRRAAEEAEKRRQEEERERQEQQQREEEERAARERERAEAAAREREAEAKREEEAAKRAEEAAAGQGQGGSGGGGQQGPTVQVPEEGRRQEAQAREQQEAARREEVARMWEQAQGWGGGEQQEVGRSAQESEAQEEQGSGQGWARRILKKMA